MSKAELQKLSADTMALLDAGRYKATVESAIARAVLDCIDRLTDDRPRKVVVQFDFVPVPEFDDLSRAVHIAGIKGSYQVKTKTPDWQGKTLDFGVNSDGTLLFSEESPDSHRQMVNYGEETDVKAVE